MKFVTATFSILSFLTLVTPASAETYGYVDTDGNLKIVVADSADIALATAPNIAFDSGVMVMSVKGLALISETSSTPLASAQTNDSNR